MPLEERVLQPICISRGVIDDQKINHNLPNELECFTNGTLANIIKQLSSLSMYAEDLFASILLDASNLINRTNTLQQKVNNLAVKVTQLDSTNEDVSLQDIHLKKPYKPQNTTLQEIFSKKTMPKSIQELYHQCSKPPSLYLLNPYRDDGKDSMKFYTNPNFFFELWRDDMLKKQVEKEKNNKKLAHRASNKMQNGLIDGNKKPRQPANTNERIRKMVSQQEFLIGEDLPNNDVIYMSNNNEAHYDQYDTVRPNNQVDIYGTYNGTATNAAINQQQIQQQLHYAYHNGTIPHHQHLHQQINGNANFINQLNSITPPPSYTQMQTHQFNQQQQQQMQQDQFNQHHMQQQNMHTLTRRTSRPSQPPPEPPALTNGQMNGHLSHNEYHQTNGYVNHYSQSNHHPHHQTNGYINHYSQTNQHQLDQQQQANLDLSNNSTNELVNAKRQQLGMPPPVPNMNNNSNDNNSYNNNLPLPPPMPINVNGQLVSSTNQQPQSQPPAPPPLPPPMPTANQLQTDETDNEKTNNNNNSSIVSNLPSLTRGTSFEQEIKQKQKQLQPVRNINRPPPKTDPRNDLLASIREGIKLRKVEDSKRKEIEKAEKLLDVASILQRRVAMELSDSESNNSDESDNDDWNDESHV